MRNFTLNFLLFVLLIFGTSVLSAQTSVEITASGTQFNPSQVTINVGDTVHWFNVSGSHSINGSLTEYENNPEPFGIAVGTGWTYSHVFTIPGVYDYHCDPHVSLGMTGVIIVEDSVTSLEEEEESEMVNQVFPIPANDYVIVQLAEGMVGKYPQLQLKLYDQLGREQKQEAFGNTNRREINVSGLQSGIYFFQLIDEGSVLNTGKIIVR